MIPEAFVETEEERFVFADWPPERSAELVLLERLGFGGEEVGGVENVVAKKLPDGAMQLVGSGARDDVGGRAEAISEFGVGVVSQNSKFGDGINRRLENET